MDPPGGTSRVVRPPEEARAPAFGPAHLLLLLALIVLLTALYLEPLGTFAYFGSDTGEYYQLTTQLATSGHLPVGGAYGGWGTGYPDFPGIFVVAAATSQSTGVDPLTALEVTIPVLAALSVAPLFLLFRRMLPNDSVALLGAAFASVAMPRAFSLAHPAPLALGDLFAVAAIWMFVEGRADARWYLPLALTASAVILTHHLSSYFFVLGAFGGLLLLELFRPRSWSARFPTREIAFLVAFLLGLDLYWFAWAPDFLSDVVANSHFLGLGTGEIGAALAGGSILLGLLAGLLVAARRRRPARSLGLSFPSDRSVLRDAVLIAAGMFGGIALLLFVPLPGTSQSTTAGAILFFSPILGLVVLSAGTRRLVTTSRLGPLVIAWLAALGGSAIFALATHSTVLLPARHAEYLLIPVGLLVALGLGRLIARTRDEFGRRAAGLALVGALLLLGANAAIVYPPPQDFGGFQEGITVRDAGLGMWAATGLPTGTVVASDHRLSSMLFGFDGDRATWDSTEALFWGSDRAAASAELNGSLAPHTSLPVAAVAVDGTMRSVGVALDPSGIARPMSVASSDWLDAAPFVPIYENQAETVYWVVGPLGPAR